MHATRTITPLLSEQNTGTSATTFSQQPQTSASTFASTSDFSNMLNQLFSGGQSLGPIVRFPANSTTTTHDLHLRQVSQQLLCAALSSATQKAYLRSWKRLYELCHSSNSFFQVPCSLSLICNFIGHLHSSNSCPSTIASHVSAISYIHKICDVPDPTQHFLVRKLIKGAQNLNKSPDNRMPITKPILLKILSALPHSATDNNNIILLRAVFLLAFNGFFRLGELVSQDNLHVSKVIQRADVSFIKNQGVQIILRHFKNMKNNQPITISLTQSKDSSICPVHALQVYISNFGHTNGPLFSFQSGTSVPHSFCHNSVKVGTRILWLKYKIL